MCTLSASALSYASPYRGAGRNGYIHTSVPMRSSMTTHSSMAQAPVAAMSSTSAYGIQNTSSNYESKAIANDVAVRGIHTSASAIQGGVTTYDTGSRNVPGRRKADKNTPPTPDDPGYCSGCGGHYFWNGYDWECEVCHCELMDGCDCANEGGYCWCPLDFNWAAALFMTALAVAYAIYKKRTCTLQ